MSWVEARLVPFALPLAAPVTTAHGLMRDRRGWLVRLFDRDGVEGHATAMPVDGFGGERFDDCGGALARAFEDASRSSIAASKPGPPVSGDRRAPFAASAWSLAELDLAARQAARPLADCIADAGVAPREAVAVNALITAESPDELRAQVREARRFEVLKLKVGADVDAALARIEAACDAAAPGQRLRVDPNTSWSEADAARALAALAGRPIEYVEQPTASTGALARLHAEAPVAVAADESVSDAAALMAVVRDRAVDVVVLKPMCIGGPRLALRLGALAQAAGVDVVVTSLLDSAIGIRAALAVALALPEAPLACGLATASLFELDLVAAPPGSGEGALGAWREPGLGTTIDEAALRACALGAERTWGLDAGA